MGRLAAIASAFLLLGIARAAGAGGVSFSTRIWSSSVGGNGLTYAVVVWPLPCSWQAARELASAAGGELVSIRSASELEFVGSFSATAGGFACTGPWIGGFRAAGASWSWTDGTPVAAFGWEPGRPAQSGQLEAALCLAGDGAHAGTWTDVLPSPDAGAGVRSAVVRWSAFADCDGDGAPDALEIAAEPSLDADGDGVIDSCANARPEDMDLDGRVNGYDLSLLLASWGDPSQGNPRSDINRDGTVNGADLGLLLSGWTG
jgi:hypothetical protein